jgi:hypothetical protein
VNVNSPVLARHLDELEVGIWRDDFESVIAVGAPVDIDLAGFPLFLDEFSDFAFGVTSAETFGDGEFDQFFDYAVEGEQIIHRCLE